MADYQRSQRAPPEMPYCVSWRLIGAGERLLDKGYLDGFHDAETGAVAEILQHLNSFAVHGQNEPLEEWWAKRTADADIEMRFKVEGRIATGEIR